MIWTLRIECVSGRYLESEWVRVVEMDSASTLFDLHELIQDAARFDRDHPFEFFAGRNYRHRAASFEEAADEEEAFGDRGASPLQSIGDCGAGTLESIFPLPKNLKLFYHFDFGDDWKFEIRRTRMKPKEPAPRVKYPRVIEKIGPQLRQYRW